MLHSADLLVLVAYLAATVGVGVWFAVRGAGADEFMAGGRAVPGWAVGLSIFGSYVSSISFLANPGKSFAGDWNAFVFTLAMPVAAAVAVIWFVPFYRRSGAVSAYEHLEQRFGPWARTYAVVCFLLVQVARMATIVFLLASAVAPLLTDRPRDYVAPLIVGIGGVMVLYTLFGGIKALVWIGVLQSAVLLAGPVVCLVVLLGQIPGGAAAVISEGAAAGKFGLGSFDLSAAQSTFWVVLAYGLVINLGNFAVDQSYVQRYIATPSVKEARRSVILAAVLYVPVAGFFFFIGTALYVLRANRPDLFPPASSGGPARADDVFPYFIANGLPTGLGGLVVAAIFAASMDSNLSSMATLTLCDLYKRYLRPNAGERESLRVLRLSTLAWGALGTVAALGMLVGPRNVLDVWWEWAGILGGGVLGLFLLGLISRAGNPAAATAVVLGLLVIVWMTVSRYPWWPDAWGRVRSTFHVSMIPVVGTLAIFLIGLLLGSIRGGGGGGKPRGLEVVRDRN